jgi:hypothetical protein
MDSVGAGFGILAVIIAWALPIAAVAYVVRVLNTILLGMRSINAGVQRTADTLERMEARGTGPV